MLRMVSLSLQALLCVSKRFRGIQIALKHEMVHCLRSILQGRVSNKPICLISTRGSNQLFDYRQLLSYRQSRGASED